MLYCIFVSFRDENKGYFTLHSELDVETDLESNITTEK